MTTITEAEVRDLATRWFDAVRSKAPLAEQRRFFAPGVSIEAWTGVTVPLEAQIAMHEPMTQDDHIFHWLKLEPLVDGRVRVTAEVRWEATKVTGQGGEQHIRADVGEDWIVERDSAGKLRFARYLASSMRYLPGSATLDI
jgi:hypothetical protein